MKAESAPATVQVSVEVRRIHTPESRAESAFSDMARMVRPQLVVAHGDGQDRGPRSGATIRVSTSAGVKMVGPEGEGEVEGDRHRLVEVAWAG